MFYDYVLVGGGLQNGLIALALRHHRPSARVALIERGPRPGGNHTWCFHHDDVPERAWPWLEPLVVHRWPRHEIIFPELSRTIEGAYNAITSEHFAEQVEAVLDDGSGHALLTEAVAVEIDATVVTLADGRTVRGHVVVDARGPDPRGALGAAAFQKFVGLEVEVSGDLPWAHPLLMDARVSQDEGFRFVYVLPLSGSRLLVEDTYFDDDPALDKEEVAARCVAYLEERGVAVTREVRREAGVLPMPWGALPAWRRQDVLVGGYQGGWVHPGTGFSLPAAVRLAEQVARHDPGPALWDALAAHRRRHESQARFVRLLNFMVFKGVHPTQRWRFFRTFYGHPEPTIHRFYALRLTPADKARILAIPPPKGMRWAKNLSWSLRRS